MSFLKVTPFKRDSWIVFLIFTINLIVSILIYRGVYGFNDDYVVVGQFKQSDFGFFQSLKWGLDSPFSAGRFLYCLLIALVFPFLKSVETLFLIRIIGVIGWCLTSVFVYKYLRKIKVRKTDAVVCAQIIQLIPGVLLHQTSAVQYPYGWASLIALIAGQCLFNPRFRMLHAFVISLFLTSVSIMIYQPSGALTLFIPIARYILERNKANSRNLSRAIVIFVFALSINYLLARTFYSSPRLETDLHLTTKIEEFFKLVIPSSLFLFDGIYSLNLTLKTLIYLIVTLILILHLRSILKFKHEGVFHKINDVLIASLFFPLTLGWLIFVPEDGISQRKIMWGSIISTTILYLILSVRQEKIFNHLKKMLILVMVIASIAWPVQVRLNHVDLQIKEWTAAQCASKKSVVFDDQEIGPYYINLIYSQKNSEYQDEYAVLSSRFPGPRIFIPFLANNEATRPTKIKSAWTLKLSEDINSVFAPWGSEFISCFNSNE